MADGHGDPKCKYAHLGASFAVEAACRVLRKACEAKKNAKELCEYCSEARGTFVREIILLWNEMVLQDVFKKPEGEPLLSCREELFSYLQTVFQPNQQKSNTITQAREYYAEQARLAKLLQKATILYGTTLKALLETEDFVLCLSIGDGDVIAVQDEQVTWIVPKEEQYSRTTDSLCFQPEEALQAFWQVLIRKAHAEGRDPSMHFDPDYILLATDGFRNSFPGDEYFKKCLVDIGKEKGEDFRRLRRRSAKWIERLTQDSYFGDDITLCFVY